MTFAEFTDCGSREINEDSIGVNEKDGSICCVLCDGLGGHGRGEEASQFVTEKILEHFNNTDDFISHIDEAFENAQKALLEKQKTASAKYEMKTTATVLVIKENEFRWGQIGDSRAYLFKNGKFKKRTYDHSVPQMLVLAREIKEKEIRNHPDRNKLLRVMGIEWGASSYEISKLEKIKKNYAFLLCSDGFWELIDEKHMASTLKESSDAQEWVAKMAEIVKTNGAEKNMDNYSAVAVIM